MPRTIEICIPVWNEERRIESLLCSLRAQSFKDFSVRVYDNCSADRTVEIARKFQSDIELEVCPRTRNIGQNSNINRSFANCTSPYVALLSGNDIVAENYLEVLLGQLEANPDAVCAYARQVQLVEDGQPRGWQPRSFSSLTEDDAIDRACRSIATYSALSNFFAFYRRSALDRAQPQPFRYGGDNVMACEIALYGKVLYTDDTFMACSASPGDESGVARVRHLLKLFSMDGQRGLPSNSRLGRFEYITPTIDMYHGHLDMFRLADIPHDMREQLVLRGTQAFFRRYGKRIDADIQRIIPVLRRVIELSPSGDLLDQILLCHALRKADECLLVARSSELVEIRNRLGGFYDAGINPAAVFVA